MDPIFLYVIYTIFATYIAFLVWAAFSDVRRFIIPNSISIGLCFLFVLAALALPFDTEWLSHLGAFAAVLVVGLATYRFGLMGAGDVKLLSALALWAGSENVVDLLLYVGLAGGAVAVLLLVSRKVMLGIAFSFPRTTKLLQVAMLNPGQGIPYGVAIAAGGIAVSLNIPQLGLLI